MPRRYLIVVDNQILYHSATLSLSPVQACYTTLIMLSKRGDKSHYLYCMDRSVTHIVLTGGHFGAEFQR